MDIYEILKNDTIRIISSLYEELDLSILKNLTIETPKNSNFGQLATNAAMLVAKIIKTNPNIIAEKLKDHMNQIDYIDSISVEGSFINFILKRKFWYIALQCILDKKDDYGKNNIGKNEKVNLEFVSANPTGLMHVGHTRGAIYGDALANLLKNSGFDVIKEFYINDAGEQINILCESAYVRYQEFVLDKKIPIPEGLYPGEYLIDTGKKLYEIFGEKLLKLDRKNCNEIISDIILDDMLILIKQDLEQLGVKHDVFFSEKTLHKNHEIDKAIEKLKSIDLIYEGELEAPKGKLSADWQKRYQLLFRSTKYGDDADRPLKKDNESWTYFASEIAYVENKIARGFKQLIFIFGADHGGYIARTKAIVEALGGGEVECNIKICQLVKFLENGLPIKMSKRKGTFTSAREVIKEVGADVIRFVMLTRKNDIELEFDLEKSKEQSKDNPVFYVQYAHVRCNSLLEKVKLDYINAKLDLLNLEVELDLIRFLTSYPHILKSAALAYEPHRIAFYLINLASKFHSLWNYSGYDGDYRFIIEDNNEVTAARLYLAACVKQVIKNGLSIIGISTIQRM
jgi:arginyl-tRNA synthetase